MQKKEDASARRAARSPHTPVTRHDDGVNIWEMAAANVITSSDVTTSGRLDLRAEKRGKENETAQEKNAEGVPAPARCKSPLARRPQRKSADQGADRGADIAALQAEIRLLEAEVRKAQKSEAVAMRMCVYFFAKLTSRARE